MAGKTIERRTAHRSQQHRTRTQAGLQGIRRKRVFAGDVFAGSKRCAPNWLARETELMVIGFGDRFQNSNRFVGNFRTNAITGQNREVEDHPRLLYVDYVPRDIGATIYPS